MPSVVEAVDACVAAGASGVTVHPRADARHITTLDVYDIAGGLSRADRSIEFNIEGDPRPDLLELVHDVKPDQCTLVPVRPGVNPSLISVIANLWLASLIPTIETAHTPCRAEGRPAESGIRYIQNRLHALLRSILLQEMTSILDRTVSHTLATWHFLQEFPVAAGGNRIVVGECQHEGLVELAQHVPGGLVLLHFRLINEIAAPGWENGVRRPYNSGQGMARCSRLAFLPTTATADTCAIR